MTAIHEAAQAQGELVDLVNRLRTGDPLPSCLEFLQVQGRLVACYQGVSKEVANAFGPKERAYLGRRIAMAKAYQGDRYGDKIKPAKDAEMLSLLAVGEEIEKEIESAAYYEDCRLLLASLDRAIDFCRSANATLRSAESTSSPYQQ